MDYFNSRLEQAEEIIHNILRKILNEPFDQPNSILEDSPCRITEFEIPKKVMKKSEQYKGLMENHHTEYYALYGSSRKKTKKRAESLFESILVKNVQSLWTNIDTQI